VHLLAQFAESVSLCDNHRLTTMPNKEKHPKQTGVEPTTSTRIVLPPMPDFGEDPQGMWRSVTVKPKLDTMLPELAEAGIGKRIAYCRGQLDNLSIEALARYTKNFDSVGVSSKSLARYEAKETLPGVRELRILADALWVPVDWLMFGVEQTDEHNADAPEAREIVGAITRLVKKHAPGQTPFDLDPEGASTAARYAQRQKWLYVARFPSKASE
jgi:transcriptional regulator with XRE-family HTH domain